MMRMRGFAGLIVLLAWVGGCPPVGDPGGEGIEIQVIPSGGAAKTAMALAPDGRIFFTEKETGNVRIISASGQLLADPFATVPVVSNSERGLLGIALHPEFADNGWVYLYYTRPAGGTTTTDGNDVLEHRVARFEADGNVAAGPEKVILTLPVEPGPNHNGGHLTFGPDGRLYISIGDLANSANAQDADVRAGKILRINDDGSIPADNPFGAGNAAFARGLRNSFDLAVDPVSGILFATENGTFRNDEVNRIVSGGNYGWPVVQGQAGDARFVDPIVDYGLGSVVPTGIAFAPDVTFGESAAGQLFVGQYSTGRILRYRLNEARDAVEDETLFAQGIAGGIVDLAFAEDGSLYVATLTQILRIVPAAGSTAADRARARP